ncbi:MAG: glycosyltransferase family 2 protein, partial [Vicinamibacterales bacterium]|nr:glycosyltransferase family 2 protein [Vicinamibacterales bacterium]
MTTRTAPTGVAPTFEGQALASPAFSVIIPTFNRAHVLPRAIESVLEQSYADFELLVVDDGSVDGTEQCVATCRDARVRYIRHGHNRGQNAALNSGLERARGTFVSFLDSDDAWDGGMLEAVLDKFRSDGELGWVHTAFRVRSATGAVEPSMGSTLEGWIYREALEAGAVSPPTTLSVRRTCFDTVGPFDLDVVVGQDDVMCLKLARSFK